MKYDQATEKETPRHYIGSTVDSNHLTNEERHILRAEEKCLAALKKE